MDKWIDLWCGFFFVLAIGLNTHIRLVPYWDLVGLYMCTKSKL